MQELAGRLEQAGRQLDGALYDARRKVEAKEVLSLAANRDREIAVKLKDRARADLEEWRENKLAALPRYRRMQRTGAVCRENADEPQSADRKGGGEGKGVKESV